MQPRFFGTNSKTDSAPDVKSHTLLFPRRWSSRVCVSFETPGSALMTIYRQIRAQTWLMRFKPVTESLWRYLVNQGCLSPSDHRRPR